MIRRWILACVLGEGTALGVLAVLGMLVSRLAPEGGWALVVLMPVLGFVEGAIVGGFQAKATGAVGAPKRWVLATGTGLSLAWLGGGLLSFFEPSAPPTLALMLGGSAIGGAVVGALVGLFQAQANPTLDRLPWMFWNALAWSSGLLVSALLSQLIWGPFSFAVFALELLQGVSVGLVV